MELIHGFPPLVRVYQSFFSFLFTLKIGPSPKPTDIPQCISMACLLSPWPPLLSLEQHHCVILCFNQSLNLLLGFTFSPAWSKRLNWGGNRQLRLLVCGKKERFIKFKFGRLVSRKTFLFFSFNLSKKNKNKEVVRTFKTHTQHPSRGSTVLVFGSVNWHNC